MKQSEPYEFLEARDSANTYFFTTSHGLAYEVRFNPSGYLFDDQAVFANYVYDFVITVPGRKAGPSDPKIAEERKLSSSMCARMPTVEVPPETGSLSSGLIFIRILTLQKWTSYLAPQKSRTSPRLS